MTDLKLQLFHNTIREHIVSQRVSQSAQCVTSHYTTPIHIGICCICSCPAWPVVVLVVVACTMFVMLTVQRFALHACKFATKRTADKETTVTESRTTLVHIEFVLFMVLISTEYEAISIYDLSKQRRAIDAADFPCLFSLFVIVFFCLGFVLTDFLCELPSLQNFRFLYFNLKLKCQHIINNLNCVWNGSIILIALI